MLNALKRAVATFPAPWQATLKRIHFARQIRQGHFAADEPEAHILPQLVGRGDWAIDVGANVGHYTLALARAVGPSGRVIAFEPMRATFALLACNVDRVGADNVTLVNAAASRASGIVGMDMPKQQGTRIDNPYEAQIRPGGAHAVLTVPLDAFALGGPVRLVKIDAEGHELEVLSGMGELLARARPTLIVEGHDREVEAFLSARGYGFRVLPGSWNRIYAPHEMLTRMAPGAAPALHAVS